MSKPVFPEKSQQPSPEDLNAELGSAVPLLQEIEDFLEAGNHSPGRDWKFYSKAAGWTVAIKAKQRNVFHLLPHEGSFTIVFTFGARAVKASEEVNLPASISKLIANARVYAEGRSFRFVVSSQSDVASVLKLVQVKLAN